MQEKVKRKYTNREIELQDFKQKNKSFIENIQDDYMDR
jgi:hypothetical protein